MSPDFAKDGILIDRGVIFVPLNSSNLVSIIETYEILERYFNILFVGYTDENLPLKCMQE